MKVFWLLLMPIEILAQHASTLYIPEKDSANAERYDYFVDLLKGAQQEGNFWFGIHNTIHNTYIAYFHLKAPADTVFKYMHLALQDDPVEECNSIFKDEFTFASIAGRFYHPRKMQVVKNFCDSVYASFDSTLIDILNVMHENDQKIRKERNLSPWIKGNEKHWEKQAVLDSVNKVLVEKIIARHGYPGRQLVGMELEEVAFLVIQHADVTTQEKYLPLIKQAVDERQLYESNYPLLVDRIRMHRKLPQIYGTQFVYNQKRDRMELYKVENLQQVDELRAKYNIGTLKEALKANDAVIPDE
jgi:hypothetical protein